MQPLPPEVITNEFCYFRNLLLPLNLVGIVLKTQNHLSSVRLSLKNNIDEVVAPE